MPTWHGSFSGDLDPAIIEDRDLARCLPSSGTLPSGRRWFPFVVEIGSQTRFFPLWNAEGVSVLHARLVEGWTDRAQRNVPRFPIVRGTIPWRTPSLYPNQIGSPEVVATERAPSADHHRGCAGLLTVATHYGCSGMPRQSWESLAAHGPTSYGTNPDRMPGNCERFTETKPGKITATRSAALCLGAVVCSSEDREVAHG